MKWFFISLSMPSQYDGDMTARQRPDTQSMGHVHMHICMCRVGLLHKQRVRFLYSFVMTF